MPCMSPGFLNAENGQVTLALVSWRVPWVVSPSCVGVDLAGFQRDVLPKMKAVETKSNLLSQWLTFKLLGITYLVGNIKFKLLFHG